MNTSHWCIYHSCLLLSILITETEVMGITMAGGGFGPSGPSYAHSLSAPADWKYATIRSTGSASVQSTWNAATSQHWANTVAMVASQQRTATLPRPNTAGTVTIRILLPQEVIHKFVAILRGLYTNLF